MSQLYTYLSSYISDPVVLDVTMGILSVLALGIILKIFCFGLYDRR